MDEDLEEVLRRKDDGALSWICAVCSELGELVYCDLCKKGFHIDEQCLGFTEAPDEEEWICSDCREAKVECFACKENGSTAPGGDIVVCSRRDCAKFFHEACLEDLEGITWGGPDEDHLVCPQHSCRACHHIMRASKLYKCLLCPVAYHEQCAPEGSHLLEEIPSHCICWRHDSDWKKQPKKLPQTRDVCEVFGRLAVPLVEIDFELPPEVLAGDSDDEGDVLRPSHNGQPQAEPASSSVHEVTPEGVPEITKKVDTGGRSDMQSKKAEVSGSKRGWREGKDAAKVEEGERDCQATKKAKIGESGVQEEEAGSSDGQEVGMDGERAANGREAETSGRGAAEAGRAMDAKHENMSHVHIDQNVWLVRRSSPQVPPHSDAASQAAPSFSPEKKLEISKVRESEWLVGAAEDVAANDFVVEYVGEVVDVELCDQRIAVLEKKRASNPHLCQLDDSLVLDAYYKGNLSRFVPHSARPNCQLQRWRVDGELRVGLFATRAIKKGDPIAYDYKAIPIGSHSVADFPLRVPTPCDQPAPSSTDPLRHQSAVPEISPSESPHAPPDTTRERDAFDIKSEETAGPSLGSQPRTEKLEAERNSPGERVSSPDRKQLLGQHSAPIDELTAHASASLVGLAPRQRSVTPADVNPPPSVQEKVELPKVEPGPQKSGLVIDVRPEPGLADENGPEEARSAERSEGDASGDADESAEVLKRRRVGGRGAVVREDSDEAEEERDVPRRGEKKAARSEEERRERRDYGRMDSPRDGRRRGDEKKRAERGGRTDDEPRRPRVSLRGLAGRKQTPGEERLERRERLRRAQEDSPQGAGTARELRRLGAKEEKTPGRLEPKEERTPGRGGSAGRRALSPERGEKRRVRTDEERGLRDGDERLPNKKRGRPPSRKRIESEAQQDSPFGPEPSRSGRTDDGPSAAATPVSPTPARPSSSHTAQSSPQAAFPPPHAAAAQPVVSASIATSPVPGEVGGGRAEGSERAPPEQEPSGVGPLAAAESAAVGGGKNGRHDDHEEAASPHIPWPREGIPPKVDPDEEDEKPTRNGGRRNGIAADERGANGRRELRDEWARRPRRVPKWGGRRSRYWVPGYPLNWTAASYLQQHNQLPAPPIET